MRVESGPPKGTSPRVEPPPPSSISDEPPSGWRLWLLAMRPRTLTIAVAPVIAGAGWAWADVDRSNSWTGETLGENYDGWTVGAGFQYAINMNWSAGLEYRYTDFGSQTFEANNGFDTEADLELHTVRFTLNYRF